MTRQDMIDEAVRRSLYNDAGRKSFARLLELFPTSESANFWITIIRARFRQIVAREAEKERLRIKAEVIASGDRDAWGAFCDGPLGDEQWTNNWQEGVEFLRQRFAHTYPAKGQGAVELKGWMYPGHPAETRT